MGYYRDTICLPEYHTPMEFHQDIEQCHRQLKVMHFLGTIPYTPAAAVCVVSCA